MRGLRAVVVALVACASLTTPARAVRFGCGLVGGATRSSFGESKLDLYRSVARRDNTLGGVVRLGLNERWSLEVNVLPMQDGGSALLGFQDPFGQEIGLYPVTVHTKSIAVMILPGFETVRVGSVGLDLMAGTVFKKVTWSQANYTAYGAPYDDLSKPNRLDFSFVGALGPSLTLGPARLRVAGYYLIETSSPYGSTSGFSGIYNHVTAVLASLVVSP